MIDKIREEQIKAIANEVGQDIRPGLLRLSQVEYYVGVGNHIALATYCGRNEEFSTTAFRCNMLIASAFCQLAANAETETIMAERLRQDGLWGDAFDQKNTANDWHAYVAHYMSLAMRSSAQDYAVNMVKAAGIAQAAVLMIDRYGRCAPRHYENLPRSGAKEIIVGGEEDNGQITP